MNLILTVFTEYACKEFVLPNAYNSDLKVSLPASVFRMRDNLDVELETIGGFWRVKKSPRYQITKHGEDWTGKNIADKDVLVLTDGKVQFTIMVRSQVDKLGSYVKFFTSGIGELTIGKDPACDFCYDRVSAISRHHASMTFGRGNDSILDYSRNGIYLNGERVIHQAPLKFGDVIEIFGLKIIYLSEIIAVNAEETNLTIRNRMDQLRVQLPQRIERNDRDIEKNTILFHRSPRKMIPLHADEEEIEAPPQRQSTNRKPAWMVIGPSFTMAIPMLLGCGFMILARTVMSGGVSSAFMYVGLITAIASAIVGVTWAIINLNYSKKEEAELELLRLQKYGDYLIQCASRIREKYEHNRNALHTMYRESAVCCSYWQNTAELWSRNRSHKDFMSYRLGLGDIPFQVSIKIPKNHFTLVDDSLAQRPREILQNYSTLTQVPINIDLYEHRIVGIVGAARDEISRLIVTQIAANNCYTDVRMAFLGDKNAESAWNYMKWFPHVWDDDHSQRYVAFGELEVSDVCYELLQILRVRSEDTQEGIGRKGVLPLQYVVIVQDPKLLESQALTKYLFSQPESIGVTTLLMVEHYEDLPNSCEYVVESSSGFCGMYSMAQEGDAPQNIIFDSVSAEAAEQLARKISGIRVVENTGRSDLPDSLTFFEMLGISTLEELIVQSNWMKNRTYQTMQAMVGWKVGGTPCYLNIHEKYHGPHGLIAGTTGSGKSETLQTYILSLAINYSPHDVGFFIIDFKGGGMANLFSNLPHMLGAISNLSGNQVHRAMVSIKSENMRRQRIFNEYGVNHIDAYTKLVKNNEASLPVPHLFIIIDEFAELKREEPDFMRELISVAQVGRSLGVHLILATQKPSGTVDDNIWSNTKFRLCLRVADKQDSKDMLHKPDAAYLTQAGRCYLQVGNDEIYELFQSGWSGAIYDAEMGSMKNSFAVQLNNNGKVAQSGGRARARHLNEKKRQWIASLVKCCQMANCSGSDCMDRIFAVFAQHGIEYADTAFNRRQMNEFLTTYGMYLHLPPEDAAKAIVEASEQSHSKLPEQREITQLDAIVDYLGKIAEETGYINNLKLWMPVLPTQLMLCDLAGVKEAWIADSQWNSVPPSTSLDTVVGLVDDPGNQSQYNLSINLLENGHLAVFGSVSSGKSTFMQTFAWSLARRYTPDMLNLYAIDYSSQMLSPLEELPHTGGIVYEGETERLAKLFLLLSNTLQERKQMMRGGSFLQYISVHGNTVPAVVLLIDGYAAFRDKTNNIYEDRLVELSRDGAGFGIFLCISAGGFGTGELQSKIGDKMRQVVCLEMDSKYTYGECLRTMHFDVLPESGVKGRGLAVVGDEILEFQTALPAEGDDYQRGELLRQMGRKISGLWKGRCARQIPEIPENPVWENFSQQNAYRELCQNRRYLPLGYCRKDASIYSIDLCSAYCYLISGRERTGKSVFLRNVACSAKDRGARVVLVDRIGETKDKRTADYAGIEYINSEEQIFALWKEIILTINERHIRKHTLEEQGYEHEEIFEKLSDYQQIFVLFADLANFVESCGRNTGGRSAIAPNVENIWKKGALHQVYFVGAAQSLDITAMQMQPLYQAFIGSRQGIHLGGELSSQKLISYKNIPFSEQTKVRKPGTGFVPDYDDSMNAMEVVIPMNKGIVKNAAE